MNKLEQKALGEAINFGKDIFQFQDGICDMINYLKSNINGEDSKVKIAAYYLDIYRKDVQNFVDIVNTKYAGIKVAEKAKKQAEKDLAKFEKVALPYLK